MIENLSIRNAASQDIDFIIETIIEADKGGTSVISACNILNISEEEYKNILKNILQENIEGQEYSLSGFLIAEINGVQVGALGSWIEGAVGVSSYILYSNILLNYLKREKIQEVLSNFKITKEVSFKREEGAIQFEYGYVKEEFRRKGIYTRLMIESIKNHYKDNKSIPKTQGICFQKNFKSVKAAEKLGFKVTEIKFSDRDELKKIFPYTEKVLLEMDKKRMDDVSNF